MRNVRVANWNGLDFSGTSLGPSKSPIKLNFHLKQLLGRDLKLRRKLILTTKISVTTFSHFIVTESC